MRTRPTLRIGDLVKLHKDLITDHEGLLRVIDIEVPLPDAKKLRLISRRARSISKPRMYSGEGFVLITVIDLKGERFTYKRRRLWRVPNQPRDKVRDGISSTRILVGKLDGHIPGGAPFRW